MPTILFSNLSDYNIQIKVTEQKTRGVVNTPFDKEHQEIYLRPQFCETCATPDRMPTCTFSVKLAQKSGQTKWVAFLGPIDVSTQRVGQRDFVISNQVVENGLACR
eukprot:703754-Rhodomonas_salina.1